MFLHNYQSATAVQTIILVLTGSYLLFVSFKRNILVMYYYVRKWDFKWHGTCFMKQTTCVHGGFTITRI